MKKFSILGAALIAAILVLIVFLSEKEVPKQLANGVNELKESLLSHPPAEEYGIEIEDFALCTDVIKANENLSEILGRNGIPYAVINEIAEKSEGVFDVRKIRTGKSYCIMRSTDSLKKVEYFIYEQDPVNYVVYEIGDSIEVYKGQKEVVEEEREASGVINSSLWSTMMQNDLDPEMAVRLSEIYAWAIDFYRIQKGDRFKVLFKERFVEGEKVGIGKIDGAWFQHRGKDFYAIEFEQEEGKKDYFDHNGNSLRKAFLKAPLQFRRVSSRFNRKRFHPILKRRRPHLGTDYAAATGTPVWSIGDGTIVKAHYTRGGGNNVEIRHNGTYTTKYLHFSKIAAGIRPGVHVSQGQVVGYVGSTGLATGPHLHFEMIKNGGHVDAMQEEVPPGDPVSEDKMQAFQELRDQVIVRLDAVTMVEVSAEAAEKSE